MADVCLVLEGTYPYVTGGVSSCIHQLVSKTPEIEYAIMFIGASKNDVKKARYDVPDNVISIKDINLFDYDIGSDVKKLGVDLDVRKIHERHKYGPEERMAHMQEVYQRFFNSETRQIGDPKELFDSREAWEFLLKAHAGHGRFKTPPFEDYFYTWRFTHFPIFSILKGELPHAGLYHSLSTGYAGLLASVAKLKYKRPFILTEHGIYTNEREIEILQAQWLYILDQGVIAREDMDFFKRWWVNIFHFMGSFAYDCADIVTTLYEGNRQKQIKHGASPEKTLVIPNGMNTDLLCSIPIARKKDEFHVSLVGRVVPIKDIKTFIKAARIILDRPWSRPVVIDIFGPIDEDEEYFNECRELARMLGISDKVIFHGKVNLREHYPYIDIMVLSSISEGQPLVVLEAFCFEIPVVATDVGSCRELIMGGSEEDKKYGAAGDVVPFGEPALLAGAVSRILKDGPKRKRMGKIAKERVFRHYREDDIIQKYLNLYNKYLIKEEHWQE